MTLSRPTRPRPAAGRNACLVPCRDACHRSWLCTTSPLWRPPMSTSRPPSFPPPACSRQVNRRFGVVPADTGSAFVPYLGPPETLKNILCLHHARTVRRDNTIDFKRLGLQLPAAPHQPNYFKTQVNLHEYADLPAAGRWQCGGIPRPQTTGHLRQSGQTDP